MMTIVYLIRHASAAGQEPEAPLTEAGRQQALRLRDFFREIGLDLIVSSPYVRALETVRPLAEAKGLAVETDPRFRERVLCGEMREDWLDLLKRSFDDPELRFDGGESGREALERALSALEERLTKAEGKRMAVVSHGNLLALLLGHFDRRFGFEKWRAMSNPDVYCIRLPEGSVERLWQG